MEKSNLKNIQHKTDLLNKPTSLHRTLKTSSPQNSDVKGPETERRCVRGVAEACVFLNHRPCERGAGLIAHAGADGTDGTSEQDQGEVNIPLVLKRPHPHYIITGP